VNWHVNGASVKCLKFLYRAKNAGYIFLGDPARGLYGTKAGASLLLILLLNLVDEWDAGDKYIFDPVQQLRFRHDVGSFVEKFCTDGYLIILPLVAQSFMGGLESLWLILNLWRQLDRRSRRSKSILAS
jgi:hypothetical protein